MATFPFQWDDPFDLDSQLSEEERMVRDSAREFSQQTLMPQILEANRNETFNPEIIRQFGLRERPLRLA